MSLRPGRSTKRVPSWTDRVLYTTYSDSPEKTAESNITNVLYTSIPSYTTSDHVCARLLSAIQEADMLDHQKPIVSLLLMPQRLTTKHTSIPQLQLPASFQPRPDPYALLKKYTGRCFDRIIGLIWWTLTLLGAGSGIVGLFNFTIGLGVWNLFKNGPSARNSV